jgi:hypothetical protein
MPIGLTKWAKFLSWVALLTAFLPSQLALRASGNQSGAATDSGHRLSVRISANKTRIRPGESVVLDVEIWNEGKQDVFIFKEFSHPDDPLNGLDIKFYQGAGLEVPNSSERVAAVDVQPFYLPKGASVTNGLAICCIALAPGHFYGGQFVINSTMFDRLRIPGRYRVLGRYWSEGLLAANINNPLLDYAEELKKLPYGSWTGEVETNSLSIEVLPQTKKK